MNTHFLAWLAKRQSRVAERILRLNPDPSPGSLLRGYHPSARTTGIYMQFIGKREFLRKYGRAAWDALPRMCIRQDGHRKAVSWEDCADMVWLLPAAHPARFATREKFGWKIPSRAEAREMAIAA